MFAETKQKVMAGLLGTLVLGMGGYWLVFAESGKVAEAGPVASFAPPMVRGSMAERPKDRDKPRSTEEGSTEITVRGERPEAEGPEVSTNRRGVIAGRKPIRVIRAPGC